MPEYAREVVLGGLTNFQSLVEIPQSSYYGLGSTSVRGSPSAIREPRGQTSGQASDLISLSDQNSYLT